MAEGFKDDLPAVDLSEQRLPEIYQDIMKSYDVLEATEESTNSDKNQVKFSTSVLSTENSRFNKKYL